MHKRCDDTYGSNEERRVSEGHKRCTSAGTDARIGGTIRVRVRCVIDRGGEGHSLQGIMKSEGRVSIVQ